MKQPLSSAPDVHAPADPGGFAFDSPELGDEFLPRHYASQFGCHGENASPALTWRNAPEATKSFAITVFDPDAPGDGFWHWLVYNIPPAVHALPAGAGDPSNRFLPEGAVQVLTDANTLGYFGPCPPRGKRHRYVFTLYACTKMLTLRGGEQPLAVEREVKKHAIAQASFTVYGKRITVNG
jgi:Raf kinase inhibitor-like YbhB/YbcL family protein